MIKILNIYLLSESEMDIIRRDQDRLKRIQTLLEIDWEEPGNETDPKDRL